MDGQKTPDDITPDALFPSQKTVAGDGVKSSPTVHTPTCWPNWLCRSYYRLYICDRFRHPGVAKLVTK
ncbi:hypothetical protein ACAH01_15950 (plasmid) [Halomicrobium sp. HM KBTZ05]|uniref:hypothetical protein n=1 Tax=Halomicrobium sp. HM KBTZ05 TaxID=3242663 RepID=UPI003557E8CE